jgi:hypothetical protein
VDLNSVAHRTQDVTQPVHHPVVQLQIQRSDLTSLRVISKRIIVKSVSGILLRITNQSRYWYTESRAKPNLPKWKREPIVVGATLDITEKSEKFQFCIFKVWDGGSPESYVYIWNGKTDTWSLLVKGNGSRSCVLVVLIICCVWKTTCWRSLSW